MGNYEIVQTHTHTQAQRVGERERRGKNVTTASCREGWLVVKNQECKPRTAIPEPPSPGGSHHCRSHVPHLLVKMKLKKSKLLVTAVKFRTPRMLHQDWKKWCCPLARCFPAPRAGSPCEWRTEKLLPLCEEWS